MKTTTHNTQLQNILTSTQSIRTLEKEIKLIKKEFLTNTIPKYKKDELYTITKVDNGSLFQITDIGTANGYNAFTSSTSTALNHLYDVKKANEERYEKMLEADNGLMLMYEFTECGKNKKAKKIGARKHVLTEYEVTKLITEKLMIKDGE